MAELAWRSEGGAEATIAFDGGMKAFHGHRRAIDGSVRQYRGAAAGSRPAPEEIPDCRVRTFATEEDGDSAGRSAGCARVTARTVPCLRASRPRG